MTAMPPTREMKELQLPTFTNWSRVWDINRILADLEAGYFYDASLLVTQMLRDDRLRGCLNVRIQSVLGMPFHFEAAEHPSQRKSGKAERVAEAAAECWPKMMPRDQLASLLKWSIMLGMGLAQKSYNRSDEEWLPSIKTWHPGAVYYDIANDTYVVQYQGGVIPVPEDDPNWVICTPYGYKYGRIDALISALALPVLCRQDAFRDRARNSERHGQPFLQLVTPTGAKPTDVSKARRALATMGSETVITTEQGEEGNKWDVKLIEAATNGYQIFSTQLDHLDDVIAVVVLGQTTSTKGQPGLGAQKAAGDVVRRDVMRFDAGTIEMVAEDILRDWAEKNYGDADLAPKLVIDVDPPEDEQKKSLVMVSVADAIGKYQAAGVNIDVARIAEEIGLPMLAGEAVTEPEEQPAVPGEAPTEPGEDEVAPAESPTE